MLNETSLDTLCASLAYAMGIDAPEHAAAANSTLNEYIDKIFEGERADRIFMYNPDAVAQWIFEKYTHYLTGAPKEGDLKLPFRTVMPSVTPVCFGTMYTGAQPEVHGIRKYEKPVIKIDTIFDALLRAGKKVAIIASKQCSIGNIFLERDLDYFHCDVDKANAVAAELIIKDEHDFIVLYNGNYDAVMHKFGPESPEALAELRSNARAFATVSALIEKHWTHHNTLLGFAMDHGAHEIDGGCGSHGLDMDEDLNILHLYRGYKRI